MYFSISTFILLPLFASLTLASALYPYHQSPDVQNPIGGTNTMPDSSSTHPTIYFGYGSNLWLHQMAIRCPEAEYLGIARLNGYKWIINDRGYANVVQENTTTYKDEDEEQERKQGRANEYEHVVFGLVYSLSSKDEEKLDKNEGVPIAYTKEFLDCDFWADDRYGPSKPDSRHEKIDTEKMDPQRGRKMLVYIDRKRTDEADPKEEYVYRMNRGIEDAVKVGVPEGYVESVMRRFIGDDGGGKGGVEEKARRQARGFSDESGVF